MKDIGNDSGEKRLEDHFKESYYLRDGKKTTLSNNFLKKASIKMDKKRETPIREMYIAQGRKRHEGALKKIKNIDFDMWSILMEEKRGISMTADQIVEAIIPQINNPLIDSAQKGLNNEHIDFIVEILGYKITNKKMKAGKYNWNAINEMVDKVFKG